MFAADKKIRVGLLTMIASLMSASALIAVSTNAMSSTANSSAVAPQDSQNISAKDELKMKLSKLVSYSANFSQSISDISGKELQRTSGTLTLKTPNMLRWETQLPDETLLIADGTTVWNVDPFVEQVTVMQQESITQNNPLMLLVSDDDKQWNEVIVERKESRFVVVSQDENANIVSLTIEFNGDQLMRLQSTDRLEQRSLLVFSNIEQNQTVAQSVFSYQIPESYIVDDQRSQ